MAKGAENTMFTKFNSMVAGGAFALGLALTATSAHAALLVSASVGGAPSVAGVTYVNFDDLANGATGAQSSGGIALTITPNARVAVGSSSGQFAAPFISGSNGTNFGNAPGQDTTPYLTTGTSSITMQFSGLQAYLGILWGSVDDYNFLDFYNGATLVGTVSGLDVDLGANGDQGVNGTLYVNINSDSALTNFDRVVARSTQFAFEFDNIAYSANRTDVPAPGALALLGLGLVGLGAASRRRKAA